jgi:hypothetical protein
VGDRCEASRSACVVLGSVLFLPARISSFLVQIWLLGARLGVSRAFRLRLRRFGAGFGGFGQRSLDLRRGSSGRSPQIGDFLPEEAFQGS